jgi:hypothetical protein
LIYNLQQQQKQQQQKQQVIMDIYLEEVILENQLDPTMSSTKLI